MEIVRLRLLGFKSFVEPTDLVIGKGLTGVVGPNGCGKSNLLEALRWVMGETSYKSMRASAMEDVIFSGSQHRPSRNSAEVAIWLDNSARMAPVDFNDSDEIEIARRIERDSGSSYRVNAREVRARDVKLLFEDAATGARSHALVRQGQIGEIVNAKPEQRRRILEDAAGIAGLHSRRHEAELRLRAAEGNLERVQDILSQLESQMNGLKRQARQAKRYKEIAREIREAEAIQLHLTLLELNAQVEAEEAAAREMLREVGRASAAESEASRMQDEANTALQPMREEEMTRAAVVERLRVELDSLDREKERAEERANELSGQIVQIEDDVERERGLVAEAGDLVAQLAEERTALEAQGVDSQAHAQDHAAETARLGGELSAAETALGEATTWLADHLAERRQVETALAEQEKACLSFERELGQAQTDYDRLFAEAPDQSRLDQLAEARTVLQKQIAEIEEAIGVVEAERTAAQEHEQATSDAAASARVALGRLETEISTLHKMLRPGQCVDWRPVVDQITVTPGYEAALGAALGDDLEASNDERAPIHWRGGDVPAGDPEMPEGVAVLADFVTGAPELARRLRQTGVVSDAQGAALHAYLAPGQRLVTLEGALWRWDGFVAAADAPTPAAQRLAERNRLMELEVSQQQARAAAETSEQAANDARTARRTMEAREKELRQRGRELQSQLSQKTSELEQAGAQARRVNERLAALGETRRHAEQGLAGARKRWQALRAEHEAFPAADLLEQKCTERRAAAEKLRRELADTQARAAAVEREREQRNARLTTIASESERWRQRGESGRGRIAELEARLEKLKAEHAGLLDVPGEIDARRGRLLTSLQQGEDQRKAASDALQHAEQDLKQRGEAVRALQEQLTRAREESARVEARLDAARTRRSEHMRHIRETLECQPDGCLQAVGLDPEAALPVPEEIARRLDKLRKDRERLGGVNLQAEEELEDVSARVGELASERNDLEEAIASLRKGISRLNREGRRRLLEAFEEVNGHFKRLFTALFGGGAAELKLVEAEDPLESGLELIAHPPGKKPTVLSLLSGGEQALTAMSLIFAVFLTNPSPICVLDEVDAPLDDANVGRFCRLLDEMVASTDTRFLVITHHPMTMARMDRLYGVTMAERGVSQLVSVDLSTAERFREAG